MSRGLGRLQRKALLALWHADGHRVPLGELKLELAADRANARRAVRGLLDRGMVKETGLDRGLALTSGAVMALFLAEYAKGAGLVEARLPSSPLDLDSILAEDEPAWEPHANVATPYKHELYPETRVSDNVGNPHGSWVTPWITAPLGDPPVSDNGPGASSMTKLIADALEGPQDEKKGETEEREREI